jgi:endonuclease/exonuclease/phosphatase family metal-dependent hydrolase
MRIATFNIESFGGEDVAPDVLEARVQALRPQIARLKADVLCLQEVNASKMETGAPRVAAALDRLLEGTPLEKAERIVSQGLKGESPAERHNLAIVSRFPVREVRDIRHDLVEPPHVRRATADPREEEPVALEFSRPVQYAALALPDDGTLHLFNVHFRAPLAAPVPGQKLRPGVWRTSAGWAEGFYAASVMRAAQALELRRAIDAVFDAHPEALVAACGDFNAEDGDTALKLAIAAEEDTGNIALGARALVPVERGIAEDRRYSVMHHARPLVLDHILVSRALMGRLESAAFHNEALIDEVVVEEGGQQVLTSSHAPLLAVFDES